MLLYEVSFVPKYYPKDGQKIQNVRLVKRSIFSDNSGSKLKFSVVFDLKLFKHIIVTTIITESNYKDVLWQLQFQKFTETLSFIYSPLSLHASN